MEKFNQKEVEKTNQPNKDTKTEKGLEKSKQPNRNSKINKEEKGKKKPKKIWRESEIGNVVADEDSFEERERMIFAAPRK